jgi:CheY-like chemotaxis protein
MLSQMPLTRILAVSYDPQLLRSRCAILRKAGYILESATSMNEAINRFQAIDFDLVLLGHSVPVPERDVLLRVIRASGSLAPVVTVAPLTDRLPYAPAETIIQSSPEKLLSGIKEVLLKAGKDLPAAGADFSFQPLPASPSKQYARQRASNPRMRPSS